MRLNTLSIIDDKQKRITHLGHNIGVKEIYYFLIRNMKKTFKNMTSNTDFLKEVFTFWSSEQSDCEIENVINCISPTILLIGQ